MFLDVETTGLDGNKDRIIEIFLLAIKKSGKVSQYETLINPERPIPKKITEITGLTDSDLAAAPTEAMVAAEIREFIGLGTPVGHNLPFDRRFLNAMFKRNKLVELSGAGVDTLAISRKLFPKLAIYPGGGGSHRLSNLMYHFGLEESYANSHRAKDDVMLLVEVFRHLQSYTTGRKTIQYPDALIYGCPTCGSTMYLNRDNGTNILSCKKQPACSGELVV